LVSIYISWEVRAPPIFRTFLPHVRWEIRENRASACCRTPSKFANHLPNAAANASAHLPIAAANLQRRINYPRC